MKKWMLVVTLGLTLVVGSAGLSQAQTQNRPGLPLRAVRTIEENARAVKHNASIYQWDRVNWEVDRMVAAHRQLHKALGADKSRAEQTKILEQHIRELRSARLARDVDRLVAVAQKLATVADLLK
jgi:hypothetical protein